MEHKSIKYLFEKLYSKTGLFIILLVMVLITPGTIYILNYERSWLKDLPIVPMLLTIISVSSSFLFGGAIVSISLAALKRKNTDTETALINGLMIALFVAIIPDEKLFDTFFSPYFPGAYTFMCSNMVSIISINLILFFVRILKRDKKKSTGGS